MHGTCSKVFTSLYQWVAAAQLGNHCWMKFRNVGWPWGVQLPHVHSMAICSFNGEPLKAGWLTNNTRVNDVQHGAPSIMEVIPKQYPYCISLEEMAHFGCLGVCAKTRALLALAHPGLDRFLWPLRLSPPLRQVRHAFVDKIGKMSNWS